MFGPGWVRGRGSATAAVTNLLNVDANAAGNGGGGTEGSSSTTSVAVRPRLCAELGFRKA